MASSASEKTCGSVHVFRFGLAGSAANCQRAVSQRAVKARQGKSIKARQVDQDKTSRSRGAIRPRFYEYVSLPKKRGRRECRMRVAPEAACATKSTRVSNQGYTASAGIPCTMVLTVSFVLSPVTGLFCHRRFADRRASRPGRAPHDIRKI